MLHLISRTCWAGKHRVSNGEDDDNCSEVFFKRCHQFTLCSHVNLVCSLCLNSNKHNKWSKNFQKRLHHSGDFSLGKYNITLDCFCSRPTGILVNSMWRNPDGIPSLKSAPSRGGCGPHLIYSSLGLPESTSQIASQSVQQFLQGSQSPQTNWPTDYATLSIAIGHI